MLSVFICLRGTKEDLKLQSTNYYVYFDMTKRKMAGVGRLMALGLNPQDHASTLDMVLGVAGGCVLREQVHGLQCTSRKAFYTKAVSVSPCGEFLEVNHLLGAAGGFRGKWPRDWQSHPPHLQDGTLHLYAQGKGSRTHSPSFHCLPINQGPNLGGPISR